MITYLTHQCTGNTVEKMYCRKDDVAYTEGRRWYLKSHYADVAIVSDEQENACR